MKNKAISYAGFFDSGKTSDERAEGVYEWYMTEEHEEAGAARIKKDK